MPGESPLPLPPLWIDQPGPLKEAAFRLAKCSILAIDSESNGLHAYREQVCLLQISDGENDYLIDTLALKDISILGPIFADPAIEKIFHACEYDILCMRRDFGFSFSNIFDTMIASRILGYAAVGLGAVLDSIFEIKLEKKYQQANWGKRPIITAMLEYARYDVHYLIPLRNELKKRLEAVGLLAVAEEDFNRLSKVALKQETVNIGDLVWRAAGKQELTPFQAAVLKELLEFRDDYARKHDIPSYKVLSNQQLLDVALNSPLTKIDLAENCNLNLALIDRFGSRLVEAVQRGLSAPPLRRPTRQRPNQDYLDRLEALRTWRKTTAQSLKVESDIVLPREVLEEIAAKKPSTPAALQEIMADFPWRYKTYGSAILNLLGPQTSSN